MTRSLYLSRTLAACFAAISDHAKQSPAEADLLYAAIASHLRSAAPMSLALPDPALAVTVELPVHLDLRDGSIDLTRTEDGRLALYVTESVGQRDAVVTMTDAQLMALTHAARREAA